MIFIGTDIIPICRIDKIIQEKGNKFLDHVFTRSEQSICNKKSIPSMHYSGKFAAKEAVKKALLSSKSIQSISLKSIEIQNDEFGAPVVIMKNDAIDLQNLKVSISHAGEYSTATAILEVK